MSTTKKNENRSNNIYGSVQTPFRYIDYDGTFISQNVTLN